MEIDLPETVELNEGDRYDVCATIVSQFSTERDVVLTFSIIPVGQFAGII